MKASGLVHKFATAMISQVAAKGYDLIDISHHAGIAIEPFLNDKTKMTPEIFGSVCRVTKQLVDDEFYGYTEHRCPLGCFYPFTLETMVREDTLEEALNRAFSFFSLVTNDIRFELSSYQLGARVNVRLARPELDVVQYLQEWWLLIWSRLAAWLIGEEIPILAVNFPHGPSGPQQEYEDAFRGPCYFQQSDGNFEFPSRLLRHRVARRQEDVSEMIQKPLVDLDTIYGTSLTLTSLVKLKMRESLLKTETLLLIENVADEFNISSQTLRRRLKKDGSTFRSLKEEVRRDVVLTWLAEPNISIGEISYRAGYAERNGLAHSVREWFGLSPSEYRQQMVRRLQAGGSAEVNRSNKI